MRSLRHLADWHAIRTYYLAQLDWSTSRHTQRSEAFDQPMPWWSYGCTHFLQQTIAPDASVLEFGAGASTAWWLERGNRVVALESSNEWIQTVRERCAQHQNRLTMILADFDEPETITQLVNGPFDVVVIDNEGPRQPLAPLALQLVREGGVIVLDNADRAEYAAAISLLEDAGYHRLDFFGIGPINAFATITSIFTASPTIEINGMANTFATVEN